MSLQITNSYEDEWKPLVEKGINTNGIFIKTLRFDERTQRSPTILLKFEAGASYPNHIHLAGEEIFVLEGEVEFGPIQLKKGDYLYTPPGEKHAVYSKTGCKILALVPREVELLKQVNF